jgi:hypothetical protein
MADLTIIVCEPKMEFEIDLNWVFLSPKVAIDV